MRLAAERPATAGLRAASLAVLAAAVTLGHLWVANRVLPDQLGPGAGPSMARMDVAFVRELAPAAAPAPAAPARQPARVAAPGPAASQAASAPGNVPPPPEPPEAGPVMVWAPDLAAAVPPPAPPVTEAAPMAPPTAAEPPAIAAAAATAPAPAASAPAFEWPPSTRLSYRVTGNYRGPVEGQARVEWLRSGTRYQVHMDLGIGPSFAPLVSRRVSSEGEITAEGLYPLRYDEETRALMATPRRVQVLLSTDTVRLANGTELPRPAGVQDSSSQFVHLTWLFTTRPDKLQPGQSVDLPLALPRRLEVWTYDVLAPETLDTPFGPVPTLHVKPRRPASAGNDLVAEVWFAPSLQYLPVRILIRQDEQTFVDLMIERLPQQAAR